MEKKIRNSVSIIPYDKDKKILLQFRWENASISPSMWSFIAGGVEKGETFEEAICREAMEELNFDVDNPHSET